jgi:hypothetical protein
VALDSARLFAAENSVNFFHRRQYPNFGSDWRIIKSISISELDEVVRNSHPAMHIFLPFHNLKLFSTLSKERKEDPLASC